MEKVEVVVVGGGPAGLAAACVLAEAGVEVLVVERGDYSGSKNVTGGRLYLEPVRPFLPDLWEGAPFERRVVKERLTMMAPESSLTVELNSRRFHQEPPYSVTVLRATFDQWLAEKAQERGAIVIPGYKVDDLLDRGRPGGGHPLRRRRDAGRRRGRRRRGPLLHRRKGRAARAARPAEGGGGIKEVIELPEEKIQDRFGLGPGQGAAQLFFGSITRGMFGGGFLYTNRRSLSLGLVLGTHALMEKKPPVQPHDLMEAFKARPEVETLITGGQSVEYSAHSIPEGGPAAMSRLVADGMVVVGDAAGLALNQGVTVRGMDLALVSGALAGRAILRAREMKDYGAATLASYEQALKASAAYQDFATFRHVPEVLSNPRLFEEYPQMACDLFEQIMWIGAQPKEKMSRTVLRTVGKFMRPRYIGDLWRMRKI